MKKLLYLSIIIAGFQSVSAQNFTRKDSLHGGLRPERTCFDVQRYDLNIKINPEERTIVGYNEIAFKVVENSSKIQLDLFDNMTIDSIIHNSKKLDYKREFNAVFIDFPNGLIANSSEKIRFYYSGKPKVAKNAPWDGGFVFKKDKENRHWIGVAVQGTGSSLWYPVKDTQTDEPDLGSKISVAVPNGLMNVSNGRFLGSEDLKNGYTRWDWEVKNPINNYDITVNIADYAHIHDNHNGLDLDYYVLKYNEEKARKHFEEVKPMMDCFQAKFGKYPFADDGYKLVETPYLGMEHQSAVAYGNKYLKGYMGSDLSGTGVGLLFDYITIHESGHEWFGNSITSADIADMWIHEGFTQYTEIVFIECQFGYEKAMKYARGLNRNVANDKPIIGPCCVNQEGSGDMYPKGALLLNTLRHVINNDELWWKIILKYSETYRHKIIDTETVVNFFNKESKMNLTPIFDQYLRYKKIPGLEIKVVKNKLEYQWKTDVADFNMPVDIKIDGKEIRLEPTNKAKKSKFKVKSIDDVEVLKSEFFVNVFKV
ncbi:M1 family metallopeptidase [Flavobacterium aquatile]|uniref:Peptidase M1 n=1 Tax=Flavobacterium aquatile LMG 4008 = ATCC 11947 TaxID=1453498 RepID=A0A095SSP9_9FLAO|nr:M1 family metallopeptidase [Flavobacterium aquatile]KGD67661.1 peptidase M1 [Flavobacterium aquatile LMG 4008 = ATCC 11947]OXA67526.1 peptidase M1 [Flavobacterium aquatile] [Flavobacterium aquatile LMG 4008 = ATCC 11947]GEC79136.1 peptidase M1 [Flavobacterium aquatile]